MTVSFQRGLFLEKHGMSLPETNKKPENFTIFPIPGNHVQEQQDNTTLHHQSMPTHPPLKSDPSLFPIKITKEQLIPLLPPSP